METTVIGIDFSTNPGKTGLALATVSTDGGGQAQYSTKPAPHLRHAGPDCELSQAGSRPYLTPLRS